jgi:hypothetical protein
MQDNPDVISLRQYVDARFEAQEKAVAAALASQEKAVAAALAAAKEAVNKAEMASERRFESVNEFRNTLSDQARTLMPRAESEQGLKSLSDKLDVLAARVNARDDRGRGMGDVWGIVIAATALVAALVAIFRGHP